MDLFMLCVSPLKLGGYTLGTHPLEVLIRSDVLGEKTVNKSSHFIDHSQAFIISMIASSIETSIVS